MFFERCVQRYRSLLNGRKDDTEIVPDHRLTIWHSLDGRNVRLTNVFFHTFLTAILIFLFVRVVGSNELQTSSNMLLLVLCTVKVMYELRAVVTHEGPRSSDGHYTAVVRAVDGSWLHCDDDRVSVRRKPCVIDV